LAKFSAITPVIRGNNSQSLALATMSGPTQNGSFQLARAITRRNVADIFAYKLRQSIRAFRSRNQSIHHEQSEMRQKKTIEIDNLLQFSFQADHQLPVSEAAPPTP